MIEKVEKEFDVFSKLFSGIGGKAKDFSGCVKLLVYNKVTHSVSINQILQTYPQELAPYLGMKDMPAGRSLYRTPTRIGRHFPLLLDRYQKLVEEHKLVDPKQVIDFSSTYLEGSKAELAEQGYSRDHRPDRVQINFGIATGINTIPTALTIQRGNVQDKKHMREMLKIIPKVIAKGSLLIFDTGANTNENRNKIKDLNYHYLTLMAKRVGTYKKHILYFTKALEEGNVKHCEINGRHYSYLKRNENGETRYVFFCPELYQTHMKSREKRFEKQKKKGNALLKKRKVERVPSDKGWIELIPHVQKTLYKMDNPYINGLEGFFILESSVDDDPEIILRLYKERDKAEKFIRALKEGIELRPIRHWNKWAIIGIFFISFLTNFLINLTLSLSKATARKPQDKGLKPENTLVKNVKLLKKYLISLTLTIAYPKNAFKFTVLSNVSQQILTIFGDFVWRYKDKSLDLRW